MQRQSCTQSTELKKLSQSFNLLYGTSCEGQLLMQNRKEIGQDSQGRKFDNANQLVFDDEQSCYDFDDAAQLFGVAGTDRLLLSNDQQVDPCLALLACCPATCPKRCNSVLSPGYHPTCPRSSSKTAPRRCEGQYR
ncbi:hypothetical protein FGO68_gene271 [Halteria grandinella]|uniref:Uncharacterized protein n=1 Tax=Halteria grandinella TaxID=5974 RepID=A0A8J8NUM6_HALGN|nr:hypothetical protein FGO68_gene271 [Halteria grandinella]